jgi:DNA-binding response OmpR family regulator
MSAILVVEDKDSVRRMLADTLTSKGHAVEVARNGHSAIEKAKATRFDLVLTDLKLPEMDGLEVLSAIKETDPETPVIVMTAYGTIETAVDAMKKGAFDFLTKPFDPDHLGVLIDRALENRRLLAENSLLRNELANRIGYNQIIGTSTVMRDVEALVKKVASSETTVLFQGESGTGKELFAAESINCRRARTSPTSRSTAPPSHGNFWRTSCSGPSRARLHPRIGSSLANSRLRTAARFSSMRWGTWICPCRQNSCDSSSKRLSNGWRGPKKYLWTCG